MLIVYAIVLCIWLILGIIATGVVAIDDIADDTVLAARFTALGFVWPLVIIALVLWVITSMTLLAFGVKRPNETIKGWFGKTTDRRYW